MSSEKLDIKTLARNLKEGVKSPSLEKQVPAEEKTATEPEKKSKGNAEKKQSKTKAKATGQDQQVTSFYAMIEEINAIEEYDHEGMVYIDSDIHDVLKKLKNTTKLKIYSLANHLFATWIEQHQDAINQVINKPKKNKFLK